MMCSVRMLLAVYIHPRNYRNDNIIIIINGWEEKKKSYKLFRHHSPMITFFLRFLCSALLCDDVCLSIHHNTIVQSECVRRDILKLVISRVAVWGSVVEAKLHDMMRCGTTCTHTLIPCAHTTVLWIRISSRYFLCFQSTMLFDSVHYDFD